MIRWTKVPTVGLFDGSFFHERPYFFLYRRQPCDNLSGGRSSLGIIQPHLFDNLIASKFWT